jgi:hypothetical protein
MRDSGQRRSGRWVVAAAAAVAVAATVAAIAAAWDRGTPPATLERLIASPDRYVGEDVAVRGRLGDRRPSGWYTLRAEDGRSLAVVVPAHVAVPAGDGLRVRVAGRFDRLDEATEAVPGRANDPPADNVAFIRADRVERL